MADFFSSEWAAAGRDAINAFPDDAYRETKLFMYWDWIDAARKSFDGSIALGVRDLPSNGSQHSSYATFTFADGRCKDVAVSDQAPDAATFVLAGNYDAWKDLYEGFDAGKAVMYRRLRLEKGDVFRFFNRIYLFTESLVALTKVPTKLPAA